MSEEAIPAATLILVRERAGSAPELLMVERAKAMAFAGGALVFPGGRIDECDHRQAAALGLGNDGAARVAAVRETIEETAVPAGLDPLPSPEQAIELQQRLIAECDFATLLEAHGLALEPQGLVPFARWLPKFHATRRFDTLFFIARAPDGDWRPSIVEGECTGALWITAADVLERDRSGEARLIFPTRRNLERLAQHQNFAAMCADARAYPIVPITPWVEQHDGEKFVTIPADSGYPVVRERLEGLWRG